MEKMRCKVVWGLWSWICLTLIPMVSLRLWAPPAWAQFYFLPLCLWLSHFLHLFSFSLAVSACHRHPTAIAARAMPGQEWRSAVRFYPEMGWGIFMCGSKHTLQGFMSWKPSTASKGKVTEPWGPPIHQFNSNTLLIFPSCAAVASPSQMQTLKQKEWYQADLGSHTAPQGCKPANFELLAYHRACQSPIRADMSGCVGASPGGKWIYFPVPMSHHSERQRSAERGLCVYLQTHGNSSGKEMDSRSPR